LNTRGKASNRPIRPGKDRSGLGAKAGIVRQRTAPRKKNFSKQPYAFAGSVSFAPGCSLLGDPPQRTRSVASSQVPITAVPAR